MEYIYTAVQEVAANGSIIFNNSIPCNKGLIYHRDESGVFIMKGIVSNPSACFNRYQITYNGNVSIPTDGTVGPISISLALGGEAILSSQAIVTPTVVDSYFNVTSTAFVDIPRACCIPISVKNTSTDSINVQNSNLVIVRVA